MISPGEIIQDLSGQQKEGEYDVIFLPASYMVTMRVLYITGSCLTRNTSANMSHNAFVKGFKDIGAEVDVIMASDSWGEIDTALPRIEGVEYIEFASKPVHEKTKELIRKLIDKETDKKAGRKSSQEQVVSIQHKDNHRKSIRAELKKLYYTLFPSDPVYPLNRTWLRKAERFKSDKEYDIVVSNSSPAASHKLAEILIKSNRVKCRRWIQIWEDPWFYDLYGGNSNEVKKEEHRLLRAAQEVCYVSPLTLMYQKKYFSDCADKMNCIPLPCFELKEQNSTSEVVDQSFGYFGDYYSSTRNIEPFYNALLKNGYRGFIYGDNDLKLKSTDKVVIHPRVTLDILSKVQEETQVLVHLSNIRGGQIPGKIYHYSATDKPILFILDGSEEEKRMLKSYFGQFDRYYFCENNSEAIQNTMQRIIQEKKTFSDVQMFEPANVVKRLIERGV